MARTAADKYTDPELRERLKNDIMQSDKGGKPGQWSARKSQLLAREYEQRGGGYRGEKDEAARSLEHWTEQDWQTLGGDEHARHGESVSRYLPKAVWNALTPEEQREAENSKVRGSEHGEQHVDWPPAVLRAFNKVENEERRAQGKDGSQPSRQALYQEARQLQIPGRSRMNKADLERAVHEAHRHHSSKEASK